MTSLAFRLESFSEPLSHPPQLVDRERLDDAYRQGVIDGRTMARDEDMQSLIAELAQLQQGLSDRAAIEAQAIRQTTADLIPVLTEIVSCLGDSESSAGLQASLQQELLRLAGDGTAPGWSITCPPRMEALIRDCVRAANLPDADIRVDPQAVQVEIVMEDGRSAFSNDRIVQHFSGLIAELQESYR